MLLNHYFEKFKIPLDEIYSPEKQERGKEGMKREEPSPNYGSRVPRPIIKLLPKVQKEP